MILLSLTFLKSKVKFFYINLSTFQGLSVFLIFALSSAEF